MRSTGLLERGPSRTCSAWGWLLAPPRPCVWYPPPPPHIHARARAHTRTRARTHAARPPSAGINRAIPSGGDPGTCCVSLPPPQAEQANKHHPTLITHDRYGNRVDQVEFHPSYHTLMGLGITNFTPSWVRNRRRFPLRCPVCQQVVPRLSAGGVPSVSRWCPVCQQLVFRLSAAGVPSVSSWCPICQQLVFRLSAGGAPSVSSWCSVCQQVVFRLSAGGAPSVSRWCSVCQQVVPRLSAGGVGCFACKPDRVVGSAVAARHLAEGDRASLHHAASSAHVLTFLPSL
jgi:hypothetical protein